MVKAKTLNNKVKVWKPVKGDRGEKVSYNVQVDLNEICCMYEHIKEQLLTSFAHVRIVKPCERGTFIQEKK